MVSHLTELKDFNQAVNCSEHSLPYDFKTIFSAEKGASKRLLKQKFKLLQGFDTHLAKILQPGERVYYVSTGVQSSAFEQQFLGWAMYILNRRAFIFTTKRMLLIQFKSKYRPWDLYAQIPYQNISKIKKSFFGYVSISFTNGKKSHFVGMPKYDRKNVVMITDSIREKIKAEAITRGSTENLCPHCYTVITEFPAACPACVKPFKSAKKAGLLSLLFPGAGDFYLGHRGIALMEIFGGAYIWFIWIMAVFAGANSEGSGSKLAVGAVFGCLVLLMHGLDSFVTYKIARKGIYPEKVKNGPILEIAS
jgi:hypothetical protein